MIVYTFARERMKNTVHLSAAVQINTPDNSQKIPYHSSEERLCSYESVCPLPGSTSFSHTAYTSQRPCAGLKT